jgi:hypothetical protein
MSISMADYLTRHSLGFSITNGVVDPSLCPHADYSFHNYVEGRAALASWVGTNQFLWGVDKTKGFRFYEQIKPVEWEVRIPDERLVGFVDDIRWMHFLEKRSTLSGVFFKTRPHAGRLSVLLPFPVLPEECLRRRVFKWLSTTRADVIEEEIFQPQV